MNWADKILEKANLLEDIVFPSITNWQAACAESVDKPTLPDLSSLLWNRVKNRERLSAPAGWFKTYLNVPEKVGGFSTKNRSLSLFLDTRGKSCIFLNGKYKGEIFLRGKCFLIESVLPGRTVELLIYVDLMLGNAFITDVRLCLDYQKEFLEKVQDFAISLRVGASLLQTQSIRRGLYIQHNCGINRLNVPKVKSLRGSLLHASTLLDIKSLRKGNITKFEKSLNEAKDICQPVAEYAKEFTLYLIGHSHIDLAWKWRWAEALECCRQTFANQIRLMKKHPGFVFVESSPAAWEEISQKDTALFSKIKEMTKKGQWEPVGGTWCETDGNLIDGESWARHFLYSAEFAKKYLNARFDIGWNIDAFGFNANLPQFFSMANIKAFVTQKLRYNDSNIFPYLLFWWQSLDGSRILGIHVIPDHYQEVIAEEMASAANEFAINTGIKDIPILFGIGNHGGGPLPDMFDRIERYRNLLIYPRVEFSGIRGYVEQLEKKYDLSILPVWRDELYLETHRKTYTTQSEIKKLNRESEVFLTNAEKFQAMAKIFNPKFKICILEKAWKKILCNQFHDVLPGTSIPSVYQDSKEGYTFAQRFALEEMHNSLGHIVNHINTKELLKGIPTVVFNTLGWERNEVAEFELPHNSNNYQLFDENGKLVPTQVSIDSKNFKLLFFARRVPSLGYRTFVMRKVGKKQIMQRTKLRISKEVLENSYFRIEIDQKSGNIKRIFDKRNKREVLKRSNHGNILQLLEDKPKEYESWNCGFTGKIWDINKADRIEVIEKGPVRAVLRIYKSFMGKWKKKYYNMYMWNSPGSDYPTSFFIQDIIIYNELDRIDFRLYADWWEEQRVLKVKFPLSISNSQATYEIPFGHINRPAYLQTAWAKSRYEVPAMRWADLSGKVYGVSLINRNKHGYDVKKNVMRLTMLASPTSNDPNMVPDPLTDRGKHACFYSLYPHHSNWRISKVIHKGWEYNTPLMVKITSRHKGRLPSGFSWLNITPSNLVLSSFKRAEDGKGYIIRFYEAYGKEVQAKIKLSFPVVRVEKCNFLEDKILHLPITKDRLIKFKVGPYQVVSIRIILKK